MRYSFVTVSCVLALGACADLPAGMPKLSSLLNKSEETAPRGEVSRAEIEKSGLAVTKMYFGPGDQRGLAFAAQTMNEGYVVYTAQTGQSASFKGNLLTATRGYIDDLLAVEASPNDPIAHNQPLGAWPSEIVRKYRLRGTSPEGQVVSVNCRYEVAGEGLITILDMQKTLTRVIEFCQGDGEIFENTYLVDPASGFAWKSEQWIGPRQGMVIAEVLEPLG